MNFKKFMSGVSALAVITGAFAAMSITADAEVTPDGYGKTKVVWNFSAITEKYAPDGTTGVELYVNAEDSSVSTEGEVSDTVAKVTISASATSRYLGDSTGAYFGKNDGSIEFTVPGAGTITVIGSSTGNMQVNGAAKSSTGTVSAAGTVKITAASGMTFKTLTYTPTGYGENPEDDTVYDGNNFVFTNAEVEGADSLTGGNTNYKIAADGSKVTAYSGGKTGAGMAILTTANSQASASFSESGLRLGSSTELNYVPTESGVVTITCSGTSGNTYLKAANGTNITTSAIKISGDTYSFYMEKNQRIQIAGASSFYVKSIALNTSGTKASLAAVTDVEKANDEVIKADEGAEGAAFANIYTFTVTAGLNAAINTSNVKVNGVSYESDTTIAERSAVLFGIIATGATEDAVNNASFTVTVE